jgi:hypothetical protein
MGANHFKAWDTKKQQSGIVSLLIVTILAIVLGLVAIGFSQLTNRELKQASDRELDAQAFYAAESGVNDALAYLDDPNATPLTGCNDWLTGPNSAVARQYFADSLSPTAKYTCVIVQNTNLPKLVQPLDKDQSVTFKINQAGLDKLYFGWENQGQNDTGKALDSNFGRLPQESSITDPMVTGLLRVGIYAVRSSDNLVSNDALNGLSRNFFMYPNTTVGSPNSIPFLAGPNGSFVHGNCKSGNKDPNVPSANGRFCKSVVTGLSTVTVSPNTTTYYVQLTALYTKINVTLWGQNSGSAPVTFSGTQADIDITGKGTDVLQRINTRVNIGHDYQYPDFALQSMKAICKGFTVEVPTPGTYNNNVNNGVMPDPDGSCASPINNTAGLAPGGGLPPN